jgi:hypothetical protein
MILLVIAAALGGGGCAAIPLTVALGGAFSAGAGAAVNAGKEYAKSGAVYRTFAMPMDDLRLAVSEVLERMELSIVRDEMDEDDREIEAFARDREITLRLEPVTRMASRLRVVVEHGPLLGKDVATATTIVERVERAAEPRLAALDRAYGAPRAARDADAWPPAPAATGSAPASGVSAPVPAPTRGAPETAASSPAPAVRPARSPRAGR